MSATAAARPLGRVLVTTVTVLLLASVLTFALGALSEANPAAAVLGDLATPTDIARMEAQFGLDKPLPEQFLHWLGAAVTGDLGISWFTGVPVSDSIAEALPVDLSIAGLALLLAVLMGGGAGIAAALNNGGRIDRAVTLVCSVLSTLPPFLIGIVLIIIFAVQFGALPTGGYQPLETGPGQWLRYAILPAFALSLDAAASLARQLRTSLVGALRENYVTGAEMRGFSARRVLFGHVLRNAAGPALTVLGMSVPLILGGAVVTEKIFNLPGMAQLSLQAAEQHDVPVVQGTLLVTVAVVVVANLAVNAALTALNPAAVRRTGPGKARGVGKTRGAGRARGAEGAPRAGRPGRLVRVTGARHGSTPGEGSTS
ncbi:MULTISPECIES: ABC transporter permease [unclassified Streptomyces]|uniref:ABC transporter permease n=1 Tax=unclassified Streptomyces TaxID=2593676 RepID=UPI002DDC0E57|nr:MULTISPECIES: ABC transporter permease [unclassified Streptomyces]WSA90848.1 ABC transporter permease [Streptomyces sp. NBC_01795]WSS16547.1 ABC transporter permease [Streptomyces sp. NBC_01186]WSS45364.1 ABC transporter permease [Streptomyces sp. NBC_01187]